MSSVVGMTTAVGPENDPGPVPPDTEPLWSRETIIAAIHAYANLLAYDRRIPTPIRLHAVTPNASLEQVEEFAEARQVHLHRPAGHPSHGETWALEAITRQATHGIDINHSVVHQHGHQR